ncbi:MAG: NAD(P)/FAD-dependent oxidoreductase [Alcanivoracaceae bacterium]|nr:NAD(P)/FAD-dependent oxidoreductase [Alcanivoracaceae bacterium]
MATEHVDVLIVGAGLSGIGAARHLQQECPNKSYAILEGRSAMGGTWDLFRYPGIRSDSDMYTLGYNFRPWTNKKAIADGSDIRQYVKDAAKEYGIDQQIRFNHLVKDSSWSSETSQWTVKAEHNGKSVTFTCNFLMMCSGYYRYDKGYTPDFPGLDQFKGQVVHPQHWPEDLDYNGKKVVVIGSGATAITLIPSMTDKAAHVTMLQRTPTYVLSIPGNDALANGMRKFLPEKLAYRLTRVKNVSLATFLYELSRRRPEFVKKIIRTQQRALLGKDFDIDKHFTPPYNPWDQRMCIVPNGDLYKALRKGKASIATDHIDTFTANGIKLKSGEVLEADIVITATGLDLVALGNTNMSVDGEKVVPANHFSYKGMMLSDVPNMVSVIGYTNASWTLKADLTSEYTCRLINHMDKNGFTYCAPRNTHGEEAAAPLLDLSSGYVQRSIDQFPKQGNEAPWKVYQNYALDLMKMRHSSVVDEFMEFGKSAKKSSKEKSRERLAS